MFNLIKRDAIIQKNQLIIFIPFILVFVIMETHPALIFLVASIFIPFNAYAYDEKAETNILLNSLPYTRKEIIAARYLGSLAYMLISVGLVSIALYLFNTPFTLTHIGIGMSIFIIFSACTFPLFYILKQGYISLVLLISFLVLVAIVPPFVSNILHKLPAIKAFFMQFSAPTLYGSILVIVFAMYLGSWVLTTFIYQRKAF